jgi:pyruvate,water dikinase
MEAPSWWRRLIGRLRRVDVAPADAEAAREQLKSRYHALRLLLAANTRALRSMATMEQAANEPAAVFGMSYVRSHCTAIGVNVFKMVRNLDALAPEKYQRLFERLEDIEGQINRELAVVPVVSDAPFVLSISEIGLEHLDVTGSKMATLGELAGAAGMRVPEGFVITTSAYDRVIAANDLQPEIARLLQTYSSDRLDELFIASSKLQQLILSAEVPADVAEAINEAAQTIADPASNVTFALRSSALGEDSANASFAGQYESLLNVRPSSLVDSYLEVVASKYTPQAMQYRRQRGLRDDQVAMSVGCLEMVRASCGGVAYSGNPSDQSDRAIHISSAWGLPKAIVDGRFASDLLVVDRSDPPVVRQREIGNKQHRFVLHPREGVRRGEVEPERRLEPSLTDRQALMVAEAALVLERHFETPVDVEWAIDEDGRLVILQCRPLSQVVSGQPSNLPADTPQPLVCSGVNASPGAASGTVHRVQRDADALSFPAGAVLVLEQPLPRWAALLGRTAAVVAEEGGVAGHLATVARELGVPAILGAGNLEALEDGREVTVDAFTCSIYPGRIEALLMREHEPAAADPPDTPVRRALRKALEHIAPLTLLDPDSLDFRPSNCKTLHDITRFCHEQAVREVFAFGSDTLFPEHAAKQLHHNVPMQWWVLDLGNGFKQPVSGKYVHLDEIACRPMHALWDGMVAIPWEGPPAVSGRGFGSVLFQATANPALSNPFTKPYANRNYFIISKHFMNLQSRFGFHFTNVEALAGERPEENYLSFSFKGGAADSKRKAGRAHFIAGLLSEIGFDTQVTEDVVTARRTHLQQDAIEEGVKVVGYLLMHTRQLDMIMGDPKAVTHYRQKMRGEIASLSQG